MKLKIFSYAILIAFTFILLNKTFAQINEPGDFCGTSEVNFQKLHIPTSTPVDGQFLRALFIFVTFSDDTTTGPGTSIWLKPDPDPFTGGTRPNNPYTKRHNIVSSTEQPSSIPFMQRYEQYTISDFFCQMSGGQLDFIGDEVYFKLPGPSNYYQNMGWRRKDLNSYILQYVHDNFTGINFANYDNWHKVGNNWVWGGDNEAEMIVIQFRKIPDSYEAYYWDYSGMIPGGEAHLFGDYGTSITLDGTLMTNDDGITATQGVNRTTHLELVLEHEISHHIFGEEFDHVGFNQWHVSIGMMTEGHGTSTYCMTPMERSMSGLNWVSPVDANPGLASQTFTLRDEFEYGDILKVPVPKANSNDPQEYFWVVNHQKKSRYDGVSRGSNTCWLINNREMDPFCDVGKGLFVFHESNKYCINNVNGYGDYGARHYAFDLKSANGRWNWNLDTHVVVPEFQIGGIGGDFNIQKKVNKNIISGVSTYNKYYLRSNYIWSAQLLNRNPCWVPPNYKITADFHGDGKDAYNMSYNEILSPYSNSSSNNYENQGFNTGVTLRLLSTNPYTGEMQVKVYYNDNLALSECPPSKPQNIKVTSEDIDPGISFHPKVIWEANIEPDFNNEKLPGHYNIWRGASYNCSAEPTYSLITTVPYYATEFIDENVLLYIGAQGGQNCGNSKVTYSYKISAVDYTNLESVKSER
ncbi:MAG TPA: hypothetical protein VIK14_01050, partial [Ignavibacteria bacterium]